MRQTTRLALTAFGLVALVATGSLWAQLPGLFSRQGIAPIADNLDGLRGVPVLSAPTLLRLGASDLALHLLLALCVLASVCVTAGVAPRWALLTLWACWLSLVQVGAPFLSFQWDILLVEGAFVLAFFAPRGVRPFLSPTFDEPGPALRLALAALACKVTLGSGIVKLASGDPTWRDLTALTFHWWTQPLPTFTSVWLNELPLVVQQGLCAVMFVLELPVPLLALVPGRARRIAAMGLIALQVGLFVAGNYSYFNVLTIALALPLLDDGVLRTSAPVPGTRSPLWAWALCVAFIAISISAFSRRFITDPPLGTVVQALAPLYTINAYGAFAVMTKTRPELIVEGSADGVTWVAYELPFKPGRLDRRPAFIAPWQPRLDWQLWFAALGTCSQNPWFLSFQQRLLEGSAPVRALVNDDPFSRAPPKYVRSTSWQYRFAPLASKAWWTRSDPEPYCPPLALGPNGQLRRATEVEP